MVALILVISGVVLCCVAIFLLRSSSSSDEVREEKAPMDGPDSADDDFDFPEWGSQVSCGPVAVEQDVPLPVRSAGSGSYVAPSPAVLCSYEEDFFDKDEAERIKAEMSAVLSAAGQPLPTVSQWGMILSPSRSTRVVAGAGSGKSTALSLRFVVMHKYLAVPCEEITIVTFTRASRADMVHKIMRDMAFFGFNFPEWEAKRVVRTFHSMVLEQARGENDAAVYFEQIGDSGSEQDDSDGLSSLNNKQLDYLRTVFAKVYKSNAGFRRSIGLVLLEKLATPRMVQYGDTESLERAIAVAEPRDRVVSQAVTDAWLSKPGFDRKKDVIEWGPVAMKTSRAGGVWYANGRVVSTGMPIVLGLSGIKEDAKETLDAGKYSLPAVDRDRTLSFLANVRLKIVATIAIEKYLYVENDEDLADLYMLADWAYRGQALQEKDTFPAFSLRIPGDTSSSSIFECLYSLGSFVASMGTDVSLTAKLLAGQLDQQKNTLEASLCLALGDFWPALHDQGHGTYDHLFLQHGAASYLEILPIERLMPMKNLLIDEFQDISGQIVRWIKAVHTVLYSHGELSSLLAVGDDWQSVYGWRGSDPEYMISFDKHFGNSRLVTMVENFRSGQHIINTAEILVKRLTESTAQRHGVAAGQASEALGNVELCTGGDAEILRLVDDLKAAEPGASIFILSRTNEGLAPFRKLARAKKVVLLTMHRAKGLEADNVIIKGDCGYFGTSALRNAIYAHAGLRKSYDMAQQDESLRLAYVSITRARKKVWWFGEPSKPGGAFRLLNEAVSGSGIYGGD